MGVCRRVALALLATIGLLVSAVLPASASTPDPTPPPGTVLKGLSVDFAGLSRPQWDTLLDKAVAAKVDVIGTTVNWAGMYPDGPTNPWAYTALDQFVADVLARGMKVRFQLIGFPQWARDPGDPTAAWLAPTSQRELALWSQWLTVLSHHFGPKVSWYEIWNEENSSNFWAPAPNPDAYARLLETSYTVIKSQSPSGSLVLFGGTDRNDPGFVSATYRAIDRDFPASLVRADHHFFDGVAVHPYDGNRDPAYNSAQIPVPGTPWFSPAADPDEVGGTYDENFQGFAEVHQVMAANGDGWKRIFISEFGYDSAPWNNYFPAVPDATRARYLTTAFALAATYPYVEALTWYAFVPDPWTPASWTLLDANWQPTLTWNAFVKVP